MVKFALTRRVLALSVTVVVAMAIVGAVYAQSGQATLTINTEYGTAVGAGSYPIGTNVTFGVGSSTVPCGSGCRYLFIGWSGAGNGSYTGPDYQATVKMDGNIVETASWETQYYLNIVKYPSNSTGTVSPTSEWVDNGTTVTVSAQSDTANNWYFLCWGSQQGACDKGLTAQHQVKMGGPYTLYANYFHAGITATNTPQKNQFGELEGNADGTFYPGDSLCSTSQVTIYPSGYDVTISNVKMAMTLGSVFTTPKINQTSSEIIACFSISPSAVYGKYPVTTSGSFTISYDNTTIPVSTSYVDDIAVVNYNPQASVIVTYPQYKDSPSPTGNATVYCSSVLNCDPTIFYRPAVILVKYYGNCPQTPDCAAPTTAERLSVNNFFESTVGIQYYPVNYTSIHMPYDNVSTDIQIAAQGIKNGSEWGITIGRLYPNGTVGQGQTFTSYNDLLTIHGFGPGYYWVKGLPSPLSAPCATLSSGTYYCPSQTAGVYDGNIGYFFPFNQTGVSPGFLEINYFEIHSAPVMLNYTEMAPTSYVTNNGVYYKFYLLPNSQETHTYLLNDTVAFVSTITAARNIGNVSWPVFNTVYRNSYDPYDQQFVIYNPEANPNVCPTGDYTTVFTATPYPFAGSFNNQNILATYESGWPNLAGDTTAQQLFLNDLPSTGNETFTITGPGTVGSIFVHDVTSQYSWKITLSLYCGGQKLPLTPYSVVVDQPFIAGSGGMDVPFSSVIPIYLNTGTADGLSIGNASYYGNTLSVPISSGLETGGLTYITAETSTGNVVMNQTVNSVRFSGPILMSGFIGDTTLNIPWTAADGGTAVLTFHNVWGYSYTTTVQIPGQQPQPQNPGIWTLESVWFGSISGIVAAVFFMVYVLKSFNVFRRAR